MKEVKEDKEDKEDKAFSCKDCDDGENLIKGYECWHCGNSKVKYRKRGVTA